LRERGELAELHQFLDHLGRGYTERLGDLLDGRARADRHRLFARRLGLGYSGRRLYRRRWLLGERLSPAAAPAGPLTGRGGRPRGAVGTRRLGVDDDAPAPPSLAKPSGAHWSRATGTLPARTGRIAPAGCPSRDAAATPTGRSGSFPTGATSGGAISTGSGAVASRCALALTGRSRSRRARSRPDPAALAAPVRLRTLRLGRGRVRIAEGTGDGSLVDARSRSLDVEAGALQDRDDLLARDPALFGYLMDALLCHSWTKSMVSCGSSTAARKARASARSAFARPAPHCGEPQT